MIFIVYFLGGVVYAAMITTYYQMVIEQRVLGSGILDFIVTIFQVFVLYSLILNPSVVYRSVAYATGSAIGTAITVYLKKRKNQ